MQPQTSHPSPLRAVDYYDPSEDRWQKRARLLRGVAGLLSISACAIVTHAWWNGWRLNIACGVTLLAALALALRALGIWRNLLYRLSWIGAIAVFGLWTAIVLSNQFHGRPPPSSRYAIAGCVFAFALSAIGLALDSRPSAAAAEPDAAVDRPAKWDL